MGWRELWRRYEHMYTIGREQASNELYEQHRQQGADKRARQRGHH